MKRSSQSSVVYNLILKLYPRYYRQKFGTQILLTFSAMYEESNHGLVGKIRLWKVIMIDAATSVPREWWRESIRQATYNPRKFVLRDVLYVLLLLTPLFVTALYTEIHSLTALSAVSAGSSYWWYQPHILLIWGALLPIVAICYSGYGLVAWRYAARTQKRKSSKRRAPTYALILLVLVIALGTAGLSIITTTAVLNARAHSNDVALSLNYQAHHPTAACQALSLANVRAIIGNDAYIDNLWEYQQGNKLVKDYSGLNDDQTGINSSTCQFHHRDDSQVGLSITVKQATSPQYQAALYQSFFYRKADFRYVEKPITLFGDKGYYNEQDAGEKVFTLRLWAHNSWYEVSAASFEQTTAALSDALRL